MARMIVRIRETTDWGPGQEEVHYAIYHVEADDPTKAKEVLRENGVRWQDYPGVFRVIVTLPDECPFHHIGTY